MNHTKEPWTISRYRGADVITKHVGSYPNDRETTIAETKPDMGNDHIRFVNAARIVECVNACAGIENPAAIPELLKAVEDMLACKTRNQMVQGAIFVEEALAKLKGGA